MNWYAHKEIPGRPKKDILQNLQHPRGYRRISTLENCFHFTIPNTISPPSAAGNWPLVAVLQTRPLGYTH